jgi:preprotein translocase subunit SecB
MSNILKAIKSIIDNPVLEIRQLYSKDVNIKNPNNPAKLISCKLITFKFFD